MATGFSSENVFGELDKVLHTDTQQKLGQKMGGKTYR